MKWGKINKLYFYIIVITITILSQDIANACWASLSAEDLISKSQYIVIGEVQGRNGTKKTSGNNEIEWQVKVRYYIKGEKHDEFIIVTTPSENYSTHYKLNEKGKLAVLFLNEEEDHFSSISPQGVIPISLKDVSVGTSNSIFGEEVVESIKVNDLPFDPEYTGKMEEFIKSSKLISAQKYEAKEERKNSWWIVYTIVVGVLLSILLKMKMSRD